MNDDERKATLLGALILGHRHAARLTQHELARRAAISVGAVRDLEQGRTRRPRPDSLAALARALRLSQDQADELRRIGTGGLWLQVLGPLQGWRNGVPLPLGGPQPRAALGLLAVAEGSLVHRREIIDALWPDDPPASAVNVVQAHMSRLRRMLGSDPARQDRGRLVIAAGAGYRLLAGPGQLDLLAFRRLTVAARAAESAGDRHASCGLYRQALDLWRGEPLANVDLLRGHPAVVGLAREHARAIIDYAQTASADGRHDQVVTALRDLVAREPLNEQAHARLMIALAGSGQQAEALAVYHQLCRRLDDELAIRPGPDLAGAHQLVLRQGVPAARPGPAAASPAAEVTQSRPETGMSLRQPPPADGTAAVIGGPGTGAGQGTALGIACSLPPDTAAFTGRHAELDRITATLTQAAATGGVVAICTIGGMPGVGKTALAVHAAHLLADRFPDRQLFVSLHAHTPGQAPVTPLEALAGLLAAAGVDARFLPADLAGRAALWRDKMAGQKALLVLDNAASSAQVGPLLPASAGCLVLVTSRRHLGDLPGATDPVILQELPPREARQMFTRLAPRAAAEPGRAITELTELAGFLPLAVSLLARVYARHPSWTLADLAAETRAGLLTMTAERDSVAAAFELSYRHLALARQRFFRRLGLHPGISTDAYAAAALTGISLQEAAGQLDALHGESLLIETGHRRYGMHDLIRCYARDLAATDPPASRQRALDRLLDYYQHTAGRAEEFLASRARTRPAQPPRAVPAAVPSLDGSDRALAWARAERDNLLACLDQAAATGQHARVVALTAAMAALLFLDGPWTSAIACHAAAVQAARRIGDRLAQANALNDLGVVLQLTGDHRGAVQALEEALDIHRDAGDRLGHANALTSLGNVRWLTGDDGGAVQALEEALDIHRDIGDRLGQANAIRTLGTVRRATGDRRAAVPALEEALDIYRDIGNRLGQANALNELGMMWQGIGDYHGAARAGREALDIYRDIGNRLGQANALVPLGAVRRLTGDYRGAAQALEEALDIHRDIGNRLGQATALCHLGAVRRATRDDHGAVQALEEALDIYRGIGNRLGQANALTFLGGVRHLTGDYRGAAQALEQALDIYREIGLRSSEAEVLNETGTLYRARGDPSRAAEYHRQALTLSREIASPRDEAFALAGRGRCALAIGRTSDAADDLRQARDIFQSIGAAEAADVTAELDDLARPGSTA